MPRSLQGFCVLLLCMCGVSWTDAAEYTYTSVDVHAAAVRFTALTGLNDCGDVVGVVTTPQRPRVPLYSFVRRDEGAFVPVGPRLLFTAHDVTCDGWVVGYGLDGEAIVAMLRRGTQLITVAVPGARQTIGYHLTPAGLLIGTYEDADGRFHGFTSTPSTGAIQPIPAPPDQHLWLTRGTDTGLLVGSTLPLDQSSSTAIVLQQGVVTPVVPPVRGQYEGLWGVNEAGVVVGTSITGPEAVSWRIDLPSGASAVLSKPGAALTQVRDINEAEDITGIWHDDQGVTHGFTAVQGEAVAKQR